MDINENSENCGGISEKQLTVALAMVRCADPLEEILLRFGVDEDEFTGWVRDPVFREYTASIARDFAEADEVSVWRSLLGLIKDGSVPAIKLYFDLQNKKMSKYKAADTEISDLRRDIFGDD